MLLVYRLLSADNALASCPHLLVCMYVAEYHKPALLHSKVVVPSLHAMHRHRDDAIVHVDLDMYMLIMTRQLYCTTCMLLQAGGSFMKCKVSMWDQTASFGSATTISKIMIYSAYEIK